VDRVLLALLRARVIEVAAAAEGHRGVILLDAAEHLLVERLLERLRGLQELAGIGILFAEIGGDGGIVLLAQPEVVVLARVAVEHVDLGDFFRDRWYRHGHVTVRSARGLSRWPNVVYRHHDSAHTLPQHALRRLP